MTTLSKPQNKSSISPQEIKPKPRYSAEFKTKSKKAQRLFAASLLKCPGNIAGWVKYDLAEKNFTLLCTLANSIYGLPPQPEKPSTSSSPPLPQEWNPPRDQSTASKSYELYSEGQQKVVETVYNAIKSNCGESKSIEMSRILLYLLLEGDCIVEREIFAVRFPNISGKFSRSLEKILPMKSKPQYSVNYVCYEGRVYSTWQYFLETNRLPNCYYAYPRDGFYPQESWIQLDFAYSPACSLLNVVAPYVDKFS
ncbi:hypothetical protein Ddc_15226 [Ditylenchus destructor]|nr:hypothetical protein Ddc_15226 [Ditylenchus destructor]